MKSITKSYNSVKLLAILASSRVLRVLTGMLYENIATWKINYMCLIIMSIYFKDPLPDAMKLKVKLPINI